MRMLVTGGSGFTGRRVIPRLVRAGHDVVALARSHQSVTTVEAIGAIPLGGDLDDPASVDAAFALAEADALVNLASLGFGHAPTIVAAAEEAGIRRAVFVSSTSVFTALAAETKQTRLAAEDVIKASALEWTILRPTMIYGADDDRNVGRLLRFLRWSPVVPLPDGGSRLVQPVHVEDVADAVVAALAAPKAVGRCYSLAGPDALSFRDLVEQAARAVGRFPTLVSVPAAPVATALSTIERAGFAAPIRSEQVRRLLEDKAFAIDDARQDLSFHPRPFVHGVLDEAATGRMACGPLGRTGRFGRTVAHLPPAQVAHRVRLRTAKAALARWPEPFERRWRRPRLAAVNRGLGDFTPLDLTLAAGQPSPEENAKGTFELLGVRRDLGLPIDWQPADVTQLWRYHLHYWEWAWPLASHPDRDWARDTFADLWASWRAGTRFGRWDEWSPYVVAVRSWVLSNLYDPLVAGTEGQGSFLDDLALHARFVAANRELDVGGNHLIKNLKALIGLGLLLGDDRWVKMGTTRLALELEIQVLPDGGHFELSPSYHAQVLGDLVDVAGLLAATGRSGVDGLEDAIIAMRRWLGVMVLPDGNAAPFGDGPPVGQDRLAALGVEPVEPRRLTVLEPSGYVVVRPSDRVHLVLDVGQPCPPQLPAHAQADCLSFVLSVDGERVVDDSGWSTYEAGPLRTWERSTAAHSTVEIDGLDQSEVWGSFRAGRLASAELDVTREDGDTIVVAAAHDGYRHLPGRPVHRRTWKIEPDRIEIHDRLTGRGTHGVMARLWLADTPAADAVAVISPSGPGVAATIARPPADAGASGRLSAVAVGGAVRLPFDLVTRLEIGDRTPDPVG